MIQEFKESIVLVTGATSGIGKCCAISFAKKGANVILTGRNQARGLKVENEIRDLGVNARFFQADVSSSKDMDNLIQTIRKDYGKLDIAVNNAGVEGKPHTKMTDYPENIWDEVININLKGVWLSMKYEIALMLEKGNGAIVNVSSIAGLRPSLTGGAAYTASKFGVIGLTKSASLEYANSGIRINSVCPAIIHTEAAEEVLGDELEKFAKKVHPIGRLGQPKEVSDAIIWLCSSQASFITGVALPINGGIPM